MSYHEKISKIQTR